MSEPQKRTRRDRLDHYLRRRFRGPIRFWHVHLFLVTALIVGVVALIFYIAGAVSGPTVAGYMKPGYWERQHFKLNAPHVPPGIHAPPAAFSASEPAALTASVVRKYVGPTVQQGKVGQCACEAFEETYAYAFYRRTGLFRMWSCAFWYALAGGGKDQGSNPTQYARLLSTVGAVRRHDYDYPDPYPQRVIWPVDAKWLDAARSHVYPIGLEYIGSAQQMGTNAVWAAESQIAAHQREVGIGGPVYKGSDSRGMFDVNINGGYMDVPSGPNTDLAGWHEWVLVGYDRTKCWGGTCGYFKAKQSWGSLYGLNWSGQFQYGHGGYFWLSFRYVAQYADELWYLKLIARNPQAGKPIPFYGAGPILDKPLPPPHMPKTSQPGPAGASGLWVQRVIAKDTGMDLAPYINAQSRRTGISAVGMLATMGAECGLYTLSPRCDSQDGAFSFGCCQITTQTAAVFGIGSGVLDGYWGPNTTRVRVFEDYAPNGIWLMAQVLRSYANIVRNAGCYGAADFPHLYTAWNAGPYSPCGVLMYPSGQAGTNYYNNFLGWMNWAYSYSTSENPRPVKKLSWPRKEFCRYAVKHHKACRVTYRGHARWQFSLLRHNRSLGTFIRERYYRARVAYMRYDFRHDVAFCWPRYGRCKIVKR